MNRSRRVLLTPGTMGPAEWADVSRLLTSSGHQVVIDTRLKYDRGMLAAAVRQGASRGNRPARSREGVGARTGHK